MDGDQSHAPPQPGRRRDSRISLANRVLAQHVVLLGIRLTCEPEQVGHITKRMAKERSKPKPPEKPNLGLEDFQQPEENQGLSLDQLSEAYAQLLDKGDDPYREPPPPPDELPA